MPSLAKARRVESIDLLRGLVMIIMAIDHVRDYFHDQAFVRSPTDIPTTTVAIFLTRWITHYCAPIFVLLAGVSAFLYGQKKGKKELSHFLLTRGLWLVFVELTILSFFRTFNPALTFVNLQVIWVIGISMMVLSVLVYADRRVVLAIGVALVVGHNLLDDIHVPGDGLLSFLWAVFHEFRYFTFGPFLVRAMYPFVPWVGVLALGYSLGHLYRADESDSRRRRFLLVAGCAGTGLFILLRAGNWYGEPSPWSTYGSFVLGGLSFLNLTKYPPSLLYLLMTIGPALVFLALTERPLNALTQKIAIFGRVPMFYYLAHFLLIHTLAVLAAPTIGYRMSDMILLSTGVNAAPSLKGFGFGLPTVYGVWLSVVLILYPACKWFDRYKRAHLSSHWWLSYL